jgi:alkylation response protein AidB-like acyl-CoA dehydrogenase
MGDDVIGADARVSASPLLTTAVDAVRGYAADAQRLEAEGVSRFDVDRLAEAGVLSAGLVEGWTPAQVREVHEQLAGASGALWFVVTQHRSPAEAARTSANDALRGRWADGLVSGSLLGAVAFAHLRRPGAPTVTATGEGSGWRVSGRLDWITSWGLADVLLLMAESPDGEVVQMLLPASDRPGLSITGELPLAAMQGTSTVGAVLDDLVVDDAEVAQVVPKDEWLAVDATRTANAPPAVFGLTRAALNALIAAAQQRRWESASGLAGQWQDRFERLRERAYELVDEVPAGEAIEERVAIRAEVTRLAQDVTSALVTVQAGRAMLLSSPEQRWAREALFALVQAQTQVTREALVAAYGVSGGS